MTKVSLAQARAVAKRIRADKVDINQLRRGIEVEKEHGDRDKQTDVVKAKDAKSADAFGKIALAHLKELPDYYTRLDKMEKDKNMTREELIEAIVEAVSRRSREELKKAYRKDFVRNVHY